MRGLGTCLGVKDVFVLGQVHLRRIFVRVPFVLWGQVRALCGGPGSRNRLRVESLLSGLEFVRACLG